MKYRLSRILFLVFGILLFSAQQAAFKLGIENLPPTLIAQLALCRIGLVTNHTGKDQAGQRTIDRLISLGVPVHCILVPEHGLQGTVIAGREVVDSIDRTTNIPVISLYAEGTGKKIQQHTVDPLDVLIVDMQDVGMRHYTYIATLLEVIEAASIFNKKIIVCDRPNPLGYCMEGPLVEKAYTSFISAMPIPLRHGMTIGELAYYCNNYVVEKPASLYVAPMCNYERTMPTPSTVSLHLSPNITTKKSCFGYSFLGLLGEVRPCDVGVGTQHAFQCITLPDHIKISRARWQSLRIALKKLHIDTQLYSYMSKRKRCMCNGLLISIEDINVVPSFQAFITVVNFLQTAGVKLTLSPDFNKAMGTDKVQHLFSGTITYQELMRYVHNDILKFFTAMQPWFLYQPWPKITAHTI